MYPIRNYAIHKPQQSPALLSLLLGMERLSTLVTEQRLMTMEQQLRINVTRGITEQVEAQRETALVMVLHKVVIGMDLLQSVHVSCKVFLLINMLRTTDTDSCILWRSSN